MVRTYIKKTDRTSHLKTPHTEKRVTTQFVALDGEGLHVTGIPQPYVLLASSGREIAPLWTDNSEGLTTDECLEYLITLKEAYPRATFVGYGMSYDFNQWLRNIPGMTLRSIQGFVDKEGRKHDSDFTDWTSPTSNIPYTIRYRPRKELWIAVRNMDYDPTQKPSTRNKKYLTSFSIWDVHGFFQASFMKALDAYGISDDTGLIAQGKQARSDFRPENKQFMIDYNNQEVLLTVTLMEKLEEALLRAKLPVKRWDGAGAVAASLMQREKVKEFYGSQTVDVIRAAEYAYVGGRIEALKVGHYASIVYHYDIRSAYPNGTTHLPNLATGHWRHRDYHRSNQWISKAHVWEHHIDVLSDFTLYRVEWDLGDDKDELPFYPFPFRERSSVIRFPRKGHNWIWGPELKAYYKNRDIWLGNVIIHESWSYEDDGTRPFSFVRDLYNQRAELKAKGDGAEKALKLAINSLYGKMAQHIGYSERSETGYITKPPFHNILYAGFITSYTRAMLVHAACQAPTQIICFATDGVFSTIPLELPISSELGSWDYETHDSMTIVQSGVYWIENDGKRKSYYRGFDPGSIDHQSVLDAWKAHKPLISVPSSRFITLGTALRSKKQFDMWRIWIEPNEDTGEGMRDLKLTPQGTKRWYPGTPAKYRPDKGLVNTFAVPADHYEAGIDTFSCRYPLPWEMEDRSDIVQKEVELETEDVWI